MARNGNNMCIHGFNVRTHMEINGNYEAIVEGCRGVLEYDNDIVRIKTEKGVIGFSGRDLAIKCLTAEALVVTGFITNIKFST